MKKILLLITLIAVSKASLGQQMERLDKEVKIICYASEENTGTRIFGRFPVKDKVSRFAEFSTTAEQDAGATIEVTYNGFSTEAQEAFQKAVDIWSQLISSDVVIRVNATWSELEEGTLGSAIWNTAYRNFDGAKELDVWYPVALAEKMAGVDLNATDEADIVANFNKGANWYLGTDGNPSIDQYDLVSVVLHELGHGLGFVDSFDYSEDTEEGSFGINDFPFIYDLSVENSQGEPLVELLSVPLDLGTALRSNSVFFNSQSAVTNNGIRPKLYAPTEWSGGSSIAHLNESTYPAGSDNSLMTPQIGANEVIHDPGQITLDMFGDMGWENTYFDHTNRPNTEDVQADSYSVTAKVISDAGYKSDAVMLYYSTDAFANDTTVVQMTATNNTDEYTAEITSAKTEGQTYSYFFSVEDNKDRLFNYPSLPQAGRYFAFQSGSDTDAPVITHAAPNFVRTTDQQLTIEATISDFLPVNAELEYFINNGSPLTAPFVLTNESSGLYTAQVDISGFGLVEGNTISYKITATDNANSQNTSVYPETGYNELNVVSTPDPTNFFFTDFNDIAAASNEFFSSANFSVKEETGFSNGALHSDHPYLDGTGANDESNYTIELKTPIIINDGEAIMSFDEVALVEPGEATSAFGDSGFYDYVIVEASKDGGSSWLPLIDGYDARSATAWSTLYNENINADSNSESVGDESLYRTREINMLANGNFNAGDEILIRFRLFADQAAHGWGWAIDNLNIQLDLDAPEIAHNHLDFLTALDDLELVANVTDNFGVDSVGVEILVNDEPQPTIEMTSTSGSRYGSIIDISALQVGDVIKYRIGAFDTNTPDANASYLPSEDSYFEVPIISLNDAQETYSNDFNTNANDFVGNFFSVDTPTGFSDGAIHSTHPYPLSFGLNGRSSFNYALKTPIVVSASKPFISYDEVLLIDSSSDYAAVEASKDGGETWFEIEAYDTSDEPNLWLPVYQAENNGDPSLYKNRIVRLTDSPQISAGDEILLRFKINRVSSASGWGWAIDNLEVQTEVITSLEDNAEIKLARVYPNPIKDGKLNIQISDVGATSIDYSIVTMSGQEKQHEKAIELDQEQQASIDVSTLPSGLFMLKVVHKGRAKVYKVLKQD